jgi:hypothetical protein
MATVIDSLIVMLGLNAEGMKRGAKEAETAQAKIGQSAQETGKKVEDSAKKLADADKKRAKEAEERSKGLAQGLAKIRNEALGLLALFTAGMGLKNFTEHTISQASALKLTAENLDMATDKLDAYSKAAEIATAKEGAGAAIIAALQSEQAEIARFKEGFGPSDEMLAAAQAAARAGVQYNIGGAKSADDELMRRADIIKAISDKFGAGEAINWAERMGITGDALNALKNGSDAFQTLVEAQKKHHLQTKEDTEAAFKLSQEWRYFAQDMTATGQQILLSMAPALKVLVEWLKKGAEAVAKWVDENNDKFPKWFQLATEKAEAFIESLGPFIVELKKFWHEIDKSVESIGGWKTVLEGLIALKIADMTGLLIPFGLALGTVASALGSIGFLGPAALVSLTGILAYLSGEKTKLWIDSLVSPDGIGTLGTKLYDWTHGENKSEKPGFSDKEKPGFFERLRQHASDTRNIPHDEAVNEAIEQLMGYGWTKDHAIGIAANIEGESGFKHRQKQRGGGGGYGYAQWDKSRRGNFSDLFGHEMEKSTRQEQIAFMDWELRHTEKKAGDKLKKTTNAADSTSVVLRDYERSKYPDKDEIIRLKHAERIMRINAMAATKMPTGAMLSQPITNNKRGGDIKSDTSIGEINIHTQATDSGGIMRDIGKAFDKWGMVPVTNYGVE